MNYGAQLFHQDKEFIKFVKIFIYLTDVDEKNGPHEYISGSHKDYSNNTPENYKMSDRLSDEYLKTKYSAERFNSFTGEAGTIIITDSNGFHKGKPLLEGQRLLLQLEFASSLYFNSLPAFATEGLTLEYQSFLKNNMRFAQNYDNERYKNDRKRRNYKRVGFFFETLKLRFKIVIKKILGIS